MNEEEFIRLAGIKSNLTLGVRVRKTRKVLLYNDRTIITIPKPLANWLSNFQIVTEYLDCKIDHVSMGPK